MPISGKLVLTLDSNSSQPLNTRHTNFNSAKAKRMLDKIFFMIACIIIPVLWGVIVNWLFNLWQDRSADSSDDDYIFPDYQI